MIPDQIYYNDTTITIGLIVCCLIVLVVVIIPKAIRHRKQVKQNESKKPIQIEQEVEMIVVPSEEKRTLSDYKKIFMMTPKIVNRKPVFISDETRESLGKIARRIGDRNLSASGFLENMAKHHLQEYENEINKLSKE